MQTQKLFNLERIGFIRKRNKEGIYLDGNEKVEVWDKKHFDNIYNNIEKYQFCYYPDDCFNFLHEKISRHYKVKRENFIEGFGADFLIREFLILHNEQRKKNIIFMDLNYEMYNIFTKGLNYESHLFDYSIDITSEEIYSTNKEKLFSQIKDNDIIIITFPNQISNYDFNYEDIDNLCKLHPTKIFFIDESYYGYGNETVINLIDKYKNIFVLRSYSKEFGIAGLRYGLLFSHVEPMKYFRNISGVYNTNIFTAKTAEYFLDNYYLIEEHKNNIIEGREFFKNRLKNKGYRVFSSNTMSIFIFFENKETTERIYNYLIDNKIYVKKYFYINAIRITCGPKYIMEKVDEYLDYNYDYFIELYNINGYVLIEDFFNEEEIFHLNNIYNKEKNKKCYEKNIYNGKILRLEKFIKNNEEAGKIILKRINILLEKIIGKNYQLFKDKIIEKYPNTKNNFNLHFDGIFKTFNYRLKKETLGWWTYSRLFTNINIMLTDNTLDNGCLYISKNIYNQNLKDINYIIDNNIINKKNGFIIKDIEDIEKKCKPIIGKRGSILIFNPLCPHYSSNNVSHNIRRNIYLTYCSEPINKENVYDLFYHDKNLIIKNIGKERFEDECLEENHLKK